MKTTTGPCWTRFYLPLLLVGLAPTLAFAESSTEHSLVSETSRPASSSGDERVGDLYRGDLLEEIGIGCANESGTSGGPNEFAVCVAGASIPPPYAITSVFYHIEDIVSPTITALTFTVWSGGETPGAVVAEQPGMPFSQGDHRVDIWPAITVEDSAFYFGLNQPQTDAGTRIGLDTSSGSPVHSFIRAPACGADEWLTMDAIGFPGNWVMSISVGSSVPIELGGGCGSQPTPVESRTWGEIKSTDW